MSIVWKLFTVNEEDKFAIWNTCRGKLNHGQTTVKKKKSLEHQTKLKLALALTLT